MLLRIQADPKEQSTRARILACPPLAAIALGLSLAAPGCLGAGGQAPHEHREPADSAELATEIEVLQVSIERDHRTLEDLITQPGLAADGSLHENPELRAIAERLTEQERSLEELQAISVSVSKDRTDASGPPE
jgi:hypothetical protein